MTERFEQKDSGLILPKDKPKPEPPKRRYGVLEIRDKDKRELAAKALSMLWDALDLTRGGSPIAPGADSYHARWNLYQFVGQMLLGKDCPEKEVLC